MASDCSIVLIGTGPVGRERERQRERERALTPALSLPGSEGEHPGAFRLGENSQWYRTEAEEPAGAFQLRNPQHQVLESLFTNVFQD